MYIISAIARLQRCQQLVNTTCTRVYWHADLAHRAILIQLNSSALQGIETGVELHIDICISKFHAFRSQLMLGIINLTIKLSLVPRIYSDPQ